MSLVKFIPDPKFDDYKETFKDNYKLERRDDGVILVQAHTVDGPIQLSVENHRSVAQVFKIVGDCNTGSYCTATVNSTGNPAAITSNGSPSIGTNNFELLGRNLPASVFGLFYYGPGQIQTTFGDGFRCVGGMTFRLPPNPQADAQGNVTKPVDFTAPPVNGGAGMIASGLTWNFQLWFRDPMGPGGTGFNLTDGLSVTFCP